MRTPDINRSLYPLDHTGDSANIAFYAERWPMAAPFDGSTLDGTGRIWCEVLCSWLEKRGGEFVSKRVPDFHVTVYVQHSQGQREVTRFVYTPKNPPKGETLSTRTVARLIRGALGLQ